MGIMFNIIDSSEGLKADLVPLKREPDYQVAFNRRIRETFTDEMMNHSRHRRPTSKISL